MNYLHKANRLIITGRSGTGKTEFFIRYVTAVEGDYQSVFIFDHEGEFAHRTGERLYSTVEELQEFKGGLQCYDCTAMYPGDLQTGLEFYCDYAFQMAERSHGMSLFCCDELQKLINTDQIPIEVATIIETGRRYQIDTVLVTQQVNLIHNRLRNQATQVCTFQQNDPNAIKWLENYGFNEEGIRNLQEGEYICRLQSGEESTGNIFGRGTQARTKDDSSEEREHETDPPPDSDVDEPRLEEDSQASPESCQDSSEAVR